MDTSAIRSAGQVTPLADVRLDPRQRAERAALVQAVNTLNAAQSFGPTSEVTFSLDRTTHKPVMRHADLPSIRAGESNLSKSPSSVASCRSIGMTAFD